MYSKVFVNFNETQNLHKYKKLIVVTYLLLYCGGKLSGKIFKRKNTENFGKANSFLPKIY